MASAKPFFSGSGRKPTHARVTKPEPTHARVTKPEPTHEDMRAIRNQLGIKEPTGPTHAHVADHAPVHTHASKSTEKNSQCCVS
jgi:hypothetical protein